MNELNKILNELIKEKGGTVEDYRKLLKSIAYHESAHTLDPTIKQQGGGPGRGKYQFEIGNNKGGITAARRTKKYFDSKGIPSPKWLEEALESESLDATKLPSEAQDVLFLGNMRMHPKADFKNVWEGKESIQDFWSKYHWAGKPKDKAKRLKSFNTSLEDLESKPQFTIPDNQEFQSSVFESPTFVKNTFADGGLVSGCGGPGEPPCSSSKLGLADDNKYKDVKNFYYNYIQSDNYLNKLKNQGYDNAEEISKSRLKSLLNTKVEERISPISHARDKNLIILGDEDLKEFNNPNILAHEYSHKVGAGSNQGYFDKKESWGEEFQMNDNDNLLLNSFNQLRKKDKDIRDMTQKELHDSSANEFKADIDTFRYMLYKNKIHDSKSNIDKSILNKLPSSIKNDKLYKRLRSKVSDDDSLIYLLNKIADNNKANNTNEAALGGLNKYIKSKYKDKNLNSFNTGGLHEQNPYGGIPQGIGSNGKRNTVEQGETSFNLPQGKFIFSDRINTKGNVNQFVDGGVIDPPNKKIESGKEYVKSWFDNSTTKARLSMNLNQGLKKSNEQIHAGLINLDKVNTRKADPINDTLTASYTPYDNEISFYTEPNSKIATHEYTHAMGSIDNDLSTYIKRNYGAIPLDKGNNFNEKQHIKYLNRQGELYSRVMELRQHLGVKPGDVIDDNHIKKLQKDNVNELMKYYKPEDIKHMLNTLASNNKNKRNNLV